MIHYDLLPQPVLSQGDVIKEFFIAFIPENPVILRKINDPKFQQYTSPAEQPIDLVGIYNLEDLDDKFQNGREEASMVQSNLFTISIISQSCDIDNKDFLSVGIVRKISEAGENKQDSIRQGKNFGTFWLPPTEIFPESFIDLSMIFSIQKKDTILKSMISKRLLSLTYEYRSQLRWRLQNFLGRPADE